MEESKGQLEQILQKLCEDYFLMATCSIVYLRKKCLIIAPFFNYVRNYFSLPGILHTPWCEKLWHFYTCCSLFTRTWKKPFFLNWFHMDYKWPDSKLTIESVSIVFKSWDIKLIKSSYNSDILSWLIQLHCKYIACKKGNFSIPFFSHTFSMY